MNKKKLSVVMAGAMLVSSVAPVLAAEVTKTEISADNLGLLIKNVREKLNITFANETDADKLANGSLAGTPVYYIKIGSRAYSATETDSQEKLQSILGKLESGQVVEIWSNGFVEKDGKYYANKEITPTYDNVKELNDLKTNVFSGITGNISSYTGNYKNIIKLVDFNENTDKLTITFADKLATDLKLTPLVLSVGDEEYDFAKYKDANGVIQKVTGEIDLNNFTGFPKKAAALDDIPAEKVEEITITAGGNNYKVEDLYDGLMLTEEGHDFLNEIKYYDTVAGDKTKVDVNEVKTNGVNKWKFTVEFKKVNALSAQTYTITGDNKANIDRLQSWLKGRLAKVDILAGDNRYETAVEIAKEYSGLTNSSVSLNGENVNIVLVNGNALVDGLAASPLAAKLSNGTDHNAPILLTEADELPKATKAYLKEVLANVKVGSLDEVTIHLVGGESVLNKSLERELKGLGFKVERYGGDNREETSLEVAEAIDKDFDEAFVVGAEGEADAMSIAAVASEQTTPIIVAKKGGLSEDALYELKGDDVTVVGGESVVSKEDLTNLKSEAKSVLRVAGSNRQATNALIIEKYYKDNFVGTSKNVVVAKDGQNNKSELVDALAAANMAAQKDAPIVLATNKLTDAQINALELNAKNSDALYQVGNGVSRDVVKTLAQRLGLTN